MICRRHITVFFLFSLFSAVSLNAQYHRTEIDIPDIPGCITLKCDFHMHTVFSDGAVWPDVRVEEAWLEGLDAISITDHIEYLPHKNDIPENHNRSFELAKSRADALGIILIRGAEITRGMPPGHFNAIFTTDNAALDTKEWRDAIKAAVDQGAFVFWNHPGWRQPDEIPIWYTEHSELLKKGWMHGMEIVNHRSYYPLAFQWCLEKKIPLLGNSDVHKPIGMQWDKTKGEQRPFTLVFAKERTAKSIHEALLAGRTAVYYEDKVFGHKAQLRPLADAALRVKTPTLHISGKSTAYLQITNSSDLSLEFKAAGKNSSVTHLDTFSLPAGRTVVIPIKSRQPKKPGSRKIALAYTIENMKIAPEQGLPYQIRFTLIQH